MVLLYPGNFVIIVLLGGGASSGPLLCSMNAFFQNFYHLSPVVGVRLWLSKCLAINP